jgi:hypothetical protein
MLALLAVSLLAWTSARLARLVAPRESLLATAVATVASICALYGLLSAASPSVVSPDPLRFGAVQVIERQAKAGRAQPLYLLGAAVLLAAGACALPRSSRRKQRRPSLMILTLSAPYLLTLFGGLAAPPRGYDALWYHLPQAVGFWRTHQLLPSGRDLVFYFPANGELLAALGADAVGARALPLSQWPFSFGSALAAAALARALGFRRGATTAAALVLASPMVLFQSQLAYVDLVALFGLGTAAPFLSRCVRAPSTKEAAGHALFGGLGLGVALGTKLAAIFWCAALAPPFLVYLLFPDGNLARPRVKRALFLVAVTAVAALAPSLFWYARNWRASGNPIFPVAVPQLGWPGLFGSTEFNPGKELELVPTRWSWLVYPWIEKVSHESGFGAAFAAMVPVGAAACAWAAWRRLRQRKLAACGLPLLWGALGLLAWWLATPHEARHLLPLLIFWGAPATALLGDRALRRPLTVAISCALLFSSVVSVRALLHSSAAELSVRPRDWNDTYDLPESLVRLIPDGAKVANRGGRPLNFALLGPRLTWRLHDFSPKEPTAHDLDYLGVQYLVYRGAPEGRPRLPGLSLAAEEPARNHAWWDSSPNEVVALYRWSGSSE